MLRAVKFDVSLSINQVVITPLYVVQSALHRSGKCLDLNYVTGGGDVHSTTYWQQELTDQETKGLGPC